MANTKETNYINYDKKKVVLMYNLVYVDTATESNLVVYDSSAVATLLGITDPLNCLVYTIDAVANVASTARVKLKFDATTPKAITNIPATSGMVDWDFDCHGGLQNNAGTGITGDITLDATGLGTGDSISILLKVRPG